MYKNKYILFFDAGRFPAEKNARGGEREREREKERGRERERERERERKSFSTEDLIQEQQSAPHVLFNDSHLKLKCVH